MTFKTGVFIVVVLSVAFLVYRSCAGRNLNIDPLALNSLDFEPSVEGAKIKVTVQIISFVGPRMVKSMNPATGTRLRASGNPDSPPVSTS
jgi:hypothetical protein